MYEQTIDDCGMTREEIAALPKRKVWYGIVGTTDSALVPSNLTDDPKYARSKAYTLTLECPASGPWHVVVLTENLHVPQDPDPGVEIDAAEYMLGGMH